MKNATGVILFDGYRVESFQFNWDVSKEMAENGNYRFRIGYTDQTCADESKQIDLIIHIFSNEYYQYEDSPLKLELILAGKFHMAHDTKWDDRWNSNALAILFPYARSIISSFTAQSGLEMINLPTFNTRVLMENETLLAEKAANNSIEKVGKL